MLNVKKLDAIAPRLALSNASLKKGASSGYQSGSMTSRTAVTTSGSGDTLKKGGTSSASKGKKK